MKQNLFISIDPELHPNQTGEILRCIFFADEVDEDGEPLYGCYDHFQLSEDAEPLDSTPVEYDSDATDNSHTLQWTRAKIKTITMQYYWDGDGMLVFIFQNGSALINSDCKKDYNWKYQDNFNQWLTERKNYFLGDM